MELSLDVINWVNQEVIMLVNILSSVTIWDKHTHTHTHDKQQFYITVNSSTLIITVPIKFINILSITKI
jgi:hypothetical protein